jgi:hypothetical protein
MVPDLHQTIEGRGHGGLLDIQYREVFPSASGSSWVSRIARVAE